MRRKLRCPMNHRFTTRLFRSIHRKISVFTKSIIDYIEYVLIKGKEGDTACLARFERIKNFEEHLKTGERFLRISADGSFTDDYDFLLPGKRQEKIDSATLICQHIFDLLSSGPKKLSPSENEYQRIDWHTDFKSGYRWNPKSFYRNIRFGHKPGVDVKVPWELSRFQHLPLLGQAFALTQDNKYADEFRNQIDDWIRNNRVGFGVNWVCTMDVAIRAVNWLVAQEYFRDKSTFSEDFWRSFFISIYEHGRYIRRHLEKTYPKANHYLSNIVGLFFIALYCPFFKESNKWWRFCVKELEKEMKNQVYDDGCNFEGSTSYHRLVLELFFYAELLSQRAGIRLSSAYHNRLKRMFTFSLYCIKPDGKIPQIGDNDNGRLLIFSSRPTLDHAYLLSLAAIHFHDPDFKLKTFPFDEEAFWVFGKEGQEIWKDLPYRKQELCSKTFPEAGWYIMRHKNHYCFVSCGPNGQGGKGVHTHNDKLSFELMLNGDDIIVDPGTYVYTPFPEWRNRFRSTAFHNAIQIEHMEQNDISADLFEMRQGVQCKDCTLIESESKIVFKGSVEYLKIDAEHTRQIVLYKNEGVVEIFDTIKSPLPRQVLLNLCLARYAPKCKISSENGVFVETKGFLSDNYGNKDETIFLRNAFNDMENRTTIKRIGN